MLTLIPGPRSACNAAQKRILIIEDEAPIRRLLASVLATCSHDVTAVTNGREALLKLATQKFDLILSDYKMPEMNGLAFYKEACTLIPDLSARFILLTGAVLCPEVLTFIGENPLKLLPKPFSPDDVTRAIAEMLREKTPTTLLS